MSGKMLIVDDQKGVRRLLEELFKKEGWNVRIAGDGLEAIDKVEEMVPDLILMDGRKNAQYEWLGSDS